ncbi:hypothetical protein DJ030_04250 [bacterium endosymbiont of Escarpia laminata]|nr:MAG: hypothetical protein DJ031_07515 [bacterium endosymbiont of Escarpia laminata]RLJ21493.1 MAG: hypothetical protein DJ030_04250 [bacterium endosymbiont of Escarpia laminata]
MKFTEEKLEQAIITLLEGQGYPHHKGGSITRQASEVLIKDVGCGEERTAPFLDVARNRLARVRFLRHHTLHRMER